MNDVSYLQLAAAEAEKYVGATAPNPPVGACVVRGNQVLGVGAHARAGTDHAEVVALKSALTAHGQAALRGATLYVTLEPCNHYGLTPPCTNAILDAGIARVVYAEPDPNPEVKGNGARFLAKAGVAITGPEMVVECTRLLDGFAKRVRTGRPWVVHKLAYRTDSNGVLTMIPERGQRTFTSEASLELAHLERKKCDAILTGIETVLADFPMLNVRKTSDHEGKTRVLGVLSRSGRMAPQSWVGRQKELGFEVVHYASVEVALDDLGARGVLRVLIEAGPLVSAAIEESDQWDERLVFVQPHGNHTEQILREFH